MNDKSTSNNMQEALGIRKKIGRTTYEVSMYFSESSKESLEDKINRLIQNDCSDLQ